MLTWFLRRIGKRLAVGDLLDFVGAFRSPCRGVYDSWDEARQAIPKGQKVGYDHSEMAPLYLEYTEKLRPSDYAVLFWMKPITKDCSSVFDLGGNIGLQCYSFEKYLGYPADLRWIVCDLPEIARFGKELAAKRNMNRLSFTDKYEDADGADILLTVGTLSFMETDLSSIISKLQTKPKHIFVNRIPLCDGNTFYTVRNLAPIMAVYRIFNRQEFIDSILVHGYEMVDVWNILEATLTIPFRSDKAVRSYSGLYFRLKTG